MTYARIAIGIVWLLPAVCFSQEVPVTDAKVRWLSEDVTGPGPVAFSTNGQSVYTADADGNVTATGIASFQPHPPRRLGAVKRADRFATSPLADRLAVHSSDGGVWLLATGEPDTPPQQLGSVMAGPVQHFRFSSDGSELVLVDDNRRHVWQVATKAESSTELAGTKKLVSPVFYSTTARFAAGANEFGGVVCVDAVTGELVAMLEFATAPLRALAFSDDNGLIAGVTAQQPRFVQVWELPSGKRTRLLPVDSADVVRLGFVASDTQLLAVSTSGDVFGISLPLQGTLRHVRSDALVESIGSSTWSADGSRISLHGTDAKSGAVGVVDLGISAMSMREKSPGYFIVPVHYATNRARLDARAQGLRARAERFFFSQWGWGFLIVALVAGKIVRWWKKDWKWSYATVGIVLCGAAALHVIWYDRPAGVGPHRHPYSTDVGGLEYGRAEVSVPERRQPGTLELPSKFWIYQEHPDPEVHFVLQQTETLGEPAFHRDMNKRLQTNEGAEALVFVHGYNVSFENALLRTAQLAVDLNLNGPACAFSWPSHADALKYTFDATNAEVSVAPFEQFLSQLVKNCQAKRIHVVAHSMGNRVLTRAMANLRATDAAELLKQKVREVILAAPDIDERVFTQELLPAFSADHHVTLYASSRDWALTVSKWFNGFRRAGDTVPEVVVQFPMDTIDASLVDTSFLGHSYYGDDPSVVTDLFQVVRGLRPAERFHLKPLQIDGKTHWRLDPPEL